MADRKQCPSSTGKGRRARGVQTDLAVMRSRTRAGIAAQRPMCSGTLGSAGGAAGSPAAKPKLSPFKSDRSTLKIPDSQG